MPDPYQAPDQLDPQVLDAIVQRLADLQRFTAATSEESFSGMPRQPTRTNTSAGSGEGGCRCSHEA